VNVGPVTQLYVSIDAGTKDALKKIDRPLFKDFWERYLASLDALRNKQQRTVYRLTLVKSYNMNEIADYARLVARGTPSFIEVKGVTYCGKSEGSDITMNNVPFHFEVKRFCEKMCSYLNNDYELACEHEHSCCCLIANKKFKVNDQWHTWIDYKKFHELAKEGKPFTAFDYMALTPQWAVWDAKERGFDPLETRVRDKPSQNEENAEKKKIRLQNVIAQAKMEVEKDILETVNEIKDEENPYLLAKKQFVQ